MTNVPDDEIFKASEAFAWATRRAFDLGLQASTGGNISIRMGPDRFLTKPTGIGLTECKRSDLVLVDGKGVPLNTSTKPTKEVDVHLGVFRVRPDVHGIVHYHAPFATAYAVKGMGLPLPTVHARRILKRIPVIAENPEGSPELAMEVAEACEDRAVLGLLMAAHGILAIGATLYQAQYVAELMEESAKIQWLSQKIL